MKQGDPRPKGLWLHQLKHAGMVGSSDQKGLEEENQLYLFPFNMGFSVLTLSRCSENGTSHVSRYIFLYDRTKKKKQTLWVPSACLARWKPSLGSVQFLAPHDLGRVVDTPDPRQEDQTFRVTLYVVSSRPRLHKTLFYCFAGGVHLQPQCQGGRHRLSLELSSQPDSLGSSGFIERDPVSENRKQGNL